MGTALVKRLSLSGFLFRGYDPDPAAQQRLKDAGGEVVSSVTALAEGADRILLSLPGPAQVEATVESLLPHLTHGTIIIDTTTGDPVVVERMAQRLAKIDVAYMDAEIGGSSEQTLRGESILLCGGTGEAFEQCGDVFAALSAKVFHTGPAGTGTRMKLTMNLALGLHRAVLGEALGFARANGIELSRALEVLKAGPAYSKVMDVKGDKILTADFSPQARLTQHLKDVRLILQTGAQLEARLPLSSLHEELLSEAVDLGYGAEDNSAIVKVFVWDTQ